MTTAKTAPVNRLRALMEAMGGEDEEHVLKHIFTEMTCFMTADSLVEFCDHLVQMDPSLRAANAEAKASQARRQRALEMLADPDVEVRTVPHIRLVK